MVSAARIIFAGIGTIFVIIAIGVGGGLMLAKTALKEPAGYQAPANTESTTSARVILPTSAGGRSTLAAGRRNGPEA